MARKVAKGRRKILSAGNCEIQKNHTGRAGVAGFTLIEMLVVLLIISILAAATVLNVGNLRVDILESEAQRLHALMRQAEDEAILQAKELAISFARESNVVQYGFYEFNYDTDRWEPSTDRLFRLRSLPDWMNIRIILEGEDIPLVVGENEDIPHIYFFSSGEKSVFEIQLEETGDHRYKFSLSNDGVNDTHLSSSP